MSNRQLGHLNTVDQGARIGYVLSCEQFPSTALLEIGQMAENAGFDMIWTSDHFHPWQDNQGHASQAWVLLAALGQRLRRVALGTGVTCPTYRYRPAIVAEAFASLGLLYPDRVFLGVGAGEALNEVPAGGGWGVYQERSLRLAEATEIIRQLWSGEWVDYAGQYYELHHARLYDVPDPLVPLYMAASGPKSMRMAGIYGDGLITDGERALKPELRAAFAAGAQSRGKDPASMPVLAEHMVVVGDAQQARQDAALWQFMPKAWESYVGDPDPVDIQRRAKKDVSLDQLISKWPVGIDPQVHIQGLQKLVDGGVTHIFVHSPQSDQRQAIEFYGREVLPHVNRLSRHAASAV